MYSKPKGLASIATTLDLTPKKDKSVVVDDFAKGIVDRVFDQLADIFPAWRYNWKDEQALDSVKKQWPKAFIENDISTMKQISHGFSKARKADTDFLPSCGKFISWCSPSAEDLGCPSEQVALKQCIEHRNAIKMHLKSNASHFIQTLYKCVDWWQMNSATGQAQINAANKAFKDEYMHLIKTYVKPVDSHAPKLETSDKVRKRMSPSQIEASRKRGLEHIREIKSKLKQNT